MSLPAPRGDGKPSGLRGKLGKALLYTSLGGGVHWICETAGHSLSPTELTGITAMIAATGENLVGAAKDLSVHVIGERLGHTLFHSEEGHPTTSNFNHDIERALARAAARTIVGLMAEWEKLPQELRIVDSGQFELEELREACNGLLRNNPDATVPERVREWLDKLDRTDILEHSGMETAPWTRRESLPPQPCKFVEFFDWRFPAAFEGNFAEELASDSKANTKFTHLLHQRTIELLGSNATGIACIQSQIKALADSLIEPNAPWLRLAVENQAQIRQDINKGFTDLKSIVTELRSDLATSGRKLSDLSREELERELASRTPDFTPEDLHRLIAYANSKQKRLGNVDACNPHFIGRTADLRKLRDNFALPGHIGVVTAVNGIGGLGKTALAIEFAHAFAEEYGGGCWQVPCSCKEDLRLALAELATPIGFEFTEEEKKNADRQFERVRRELKELANTYAPGRCLLILDNVDRPSLLDPATIARLNVGDWLHVLATTQLGENELPTNENELCLIAIDKMPEKDALALIERYQPAQKFSSGLEGDAALGIVRLLDGFTLAVESAAVYLGQFADDVTCAAFLARLKKEGLEGLDRAATQSNKKVRHGEKRLSATLQPTLERLGAPERLALEFAALLPPDVVPLPWLRALVSRTFPDVERDAEPGYTNPWKNVLRSLLSLRLLQGTDQVEDSAQLRVARIHRLIQQLVRDNLTEERRLTVQNTLKFMKRQQDGRASSGNWSH